MLISKRKYIYNAFNKNKLYLIQVIHNKNNIFNPSVTKNNHYQNRSYKYSEFYKRTLRGKIFKLSKGSTSDKLQALKIAKELEDKSTLPILIKG